MEKENEIIKKMEKEIRRIYRNFTNFKVQYARFFDMSDIRKMQVISGSLYRLMEKIDLFRKGGD